MIGGFDDGLLCVGPAQATIGALRNVEDELSLSVMAVANEGTPGDGVRVNRDAGHIDAVTSQTLEVQVPEIIVSDAGNKRTGPTQMRDLINEDRRGTGRIRSHQLDRLTETVARGHGHDLNEHFANR